jgi:hypothetical protein
MIHYKLDPLVKTASIGMLKEGIKSPSIARLLRLSQPVIETHLGWWVHERMQRETGRTFSTYRATAAAELKVSYQSVKRWHHWFLRQCQLSPDMSLRVMEAEEYQRQTPNVRHDLQQWAEWDTMPLEENSGPRSSSKNSA